LISQKIVAPTRQILAAIIFSAFFGSGGAALAALGDVRAPVIAQLRGDASVNSQKRLQNLASNPGGNANFSTKEISLDTGTQVVEYIDGAGRVFAISWEGPVLPPLDQWLGSYFPAFANEISNSRKTSSLGTPRSVMVDALVVQSRGRMRHFSGHAYVTVLVPAGLKIQDVLP
jgi:hypothetical protein